MTDDTQTQEKTEGQETNEATETNSTEANEGENPIDRANKAAERLEKANEEASKIVARQEKVLAEAKLQGRSLAGLIEDKTPKKDSSKEYAMKALNGEISK